jgi:serine/threonine-protein kinase RsbW
LRERVEAPAHVLAIEPGSILLAYSDGLIEFDRDPVAGEQAVIDALRAVSGGDVARAIDARVTGGRDTRDDIAILAVTLETPLSKIPMPFGAVRWRFATHDAAAARRARRAFAAQLRALGVGAEDVASAELVFGELLGNAVRYAEGVVDIVLDVSGDAPVLHVFDEGEGFELRPRLPADPMSERGRGLYLVRALSEELSVECRREGGSHARAVLSGRPSRSRARDAGETSGSAARR